MPHLRKRIEVTIDLNYLKPKQVWRVTRLSVRSLLRTRPWTQGIAIKKTFPDPGAALTEAKQRARQMIEKHLGSVPEDEIVWTIIPPMKDCPEVPLAVKARRCAS